MYEVILDRIAAIFTYCSIGGSYQKKKKSDFFSLSFPQLLRTEIVFQYIFSIAFFTNFPAIKKTKPHELSFAKLISVDKRGVLFIL